MSLLINDARIFSKVLKGTRKKKHLTQAECAELLDISVSYQKDWERCRGTPSLEKFYHVCRTLNISADSFIFPENPNEDSTYNELIRLLSQCDESNLKILKTLAIALLEAKHDSLS